MLTAFKEGVWLDSGPVQTLGLRLSVTMTVLRLSDGALLIHSPLPLTPERRAQITVLGRVAHLYAPNTFHHLWLREWAEAFPDARVHAPEQLKAKRPDLRIDRCHDRDDQHGFGSNLVELPIRGFRLRETALVHQTARAVIVADLVHNIGRPEHGWTRFYSQAMGFYDRVALSRVLRWTAFEDRAAARRSVDALLEHDFDGLVVGHGAPLCAHGRAALAGATAWLASAPPRLLASGSAPPRWPSPRPCG